MTDTFMRITCEEKPEPAARYASGLTVYEEALVETRWVGRFWSAIGIIEAGSQPRGSLYLNKAFALEIDGASLHHGWAWDGFEELAAEREGQQHACVKLRHATRPVSVRVHTVVDGTAVLTRWLEITNTGDRSAALSAVKVWSGNVFPLQNDTWKTVHEPYSLGRFTDDNWGNEGLFEWTPIGTDALEIGEDGGKSGWGHPIVYLRDEAAGCLFVAQLAWSGNWKIRVEKKNEPVYLEIGPASTAPMRVLDAGETIVTPPVHIGCVDGDLTAMVQQLHEHQRRSVILPPPKGGANLVTYNHWGYMGHEMSEERLLKEIDIAADVGAECFIVDAGWYGDKNVGWGMIPGYWRTGSRLPNGLKPVFDYAHKKGLKAGLWHWIEAASLKVGLWHGNEAAIPTGQLIKDHPDWLLARDGKQLDNLLDLTRPEVAKHVESEIARTIEEYELDMFRLDYNAAPGEGGYNLRHGFEENTIWRHYEVMYGIWERLRKKFPHLILENCAGGGGRTDLGQLSRFHYTQSSDYWLLPRSVRIHNGLMLALAPELLNRLYGVATGSHHGGDLDTGLRANFLCGTPGLSGIWPTLADKNPIAFQKIRNAVAFYKQHLRPMIRSCRFYHHDPVLKGLHPEGWCVWEFAAPDASKSILGVFRLAGQGETERQVRPRGISRSGTCRVTLGNREERFTMPGHELANAGIQIRLPNPLASELVLIESA